MFILYKFKKSKLKSSTIIVAILNITSNFLEFIQGESIGIHGRFGIPGKYLKANISCNPPKSI
jgi:hypothetical protein